MKKRIALLMAVVMTLLCVVFSGCSVDSSTRGSNSNKIALTPDNFEKYVTMKLKGYGSDYSDSIRPQYGSVTVTGEITGISGWTYENVEVVISVEFSGWYSKSLDNFNKRGDPFDEVVTTDPITLNVGGNGSVYCVKKISELDSDGYYVDDDIKCLGYQIVSVSGYIIKD